MKGEGTPTMSVGPETLIKVLSFVLFTVVIVTTVVSFQMYQISYKSRADYRNLIDFAENILSSECLAYVSKTTGQDGGTVNRGIFNKTKLDQSSSICVQVNQPYYVEIKDENKNVWTFGSVSPTAPSEKLYYPVLVKYSDEILPAKMTVEIYV